MLLFFFFFLLVSDVLYVCVCNVTAANLIWARCNMRLIVNKINRGNDVEVKKG